MASHSGFAIFGLPVLKVQCDPMLSAHISKFLLCVKDYIARPSNMRQVALSLYMCEFVCYMAENEKKARQKTCLTGSCGDC